MLTMLVTGVGAPGTWGTLHALRHNPAAERVRIVGIDIQPAPAGSYLVDAFHRVPRPSGAGYLDHLLEICRTDGVDIIVPQTTAEAEFLAKHADLVRGAGIALLAPPWPAFRIANDKAILAREAGRLGLPVARGRVIASVEELEAFACDLGYPQRPFTIKPPVSSGMRGFRIVREVVWTAEKFLTEKPRGENITLSTLRGMLAPFVNFPPLLAAEYLPGQEYTVDAFTHCDVMVIVPRKRVVMRSGITFVAEIEYREDLVATTRVLLRGLGLTGCVGFQFREDESGTPRLLECNPRVQGTMVASLVSGYNLIWAAVCAALHRPLPPLPKKLAAGHFVRYWGGVGVNDRGDVVVR